MLASHRICVCVVLCAFVVPEIFLQNPSKAEKLEGEILEECKKASRRTLKQIVKKMGICNSWMKKNTTSREEHVKKMGCVVKCILEKENMLDETGFVSNATIELSIRDRATEGKPKDIVRHLFHDCNNKFGKDLKPKDEYCAGYSQFGNCIQNSVADACHVEIPF